MFILLFYITIVLSYYRIMFYYRRIAGLIFKSIYASERNFSHAWGDMRGIFERNFKAMRGILGVLYRNERNISPLCA